MKQHQKLITVLAVISATIAISLARTEIPKTDADREREPLRAVNWLKISPWPNQQIASDASIEFLR
jgi:hypothetical protein